ncbi:phosphoribulokinase / Uridine kinase family protein [Klosneuvirus KNV1]|uniref:Phosphoribulokinase / Uridine kinase family protein n=1 Tax=Klosneuvirus KNV1 TaxID=1977640 RepID=A0A1V0SL67_9VIRU|nr:phosphoribulokinase / Uridine kinase family protein [Klosneuvirus KNV1]ARF12658.1 phosphoribulokinase / Uridine kinase family protein [Klosneuvirus KNV1]
MASIYVVAVCGESCSGKTTVCRKIIERIAKINFSGQNLVAVVSQDSYYKGGNSQTNYDVPDSINFTEMIRDVKKLKNGEVIETPIYEFATHSRQKETKRIGPAKIIIIEGILILTQKELCDICDLKIYVSAFPQLMYSRRMKRDVEERGRTPEEVEERYFRDVLPASQQFVVPSENFADIVLKNNTHNRFIGLEILLDHIDKKIHEMK